MEFFYFPLIIVNTLVSFIPIIKNAKVISHYFFNAMVLCLSYWMLSCFFLWESTNLTFWARQAFVGPSMFPFFLYLFFECVRDQNKTQNLSYKEYLFITVAFFFAVLSNTGFIVKNVDSITNVSFGPGHKLFSVYFISSCFYVIVKNYKIATKMKGQKRTQLMYLLLGIIVEVVLGTFFNLVLPLFGISKFTFLGPFFSIGFVSFFCYAILKHELLDISIVITKSVSWILTYMTFLFLFLGIYLPLSDFIHTSAWLSIHSIGIMYLFVTVYYSHKLQKFYFTPLEKKFVKQTFNKEKVVSNISKELLRAKTKPEIFEAIGYEIATEMELKNFGKLFPVIKNKEKGYMLSESKSDDKEGKFILKNSLFISVAREKKAPFLYQELDSILKDYLSNLSAASKQTKQSEQSKLIIIPGSLFIPIWSLDQFEGLIILGPKINEEPFLESDIYLLESIMNQIVIAFEKLSHQENLIKVNKQLKSEIQIKQKALDAAKDAAKYRTYSTLTKQISHEIRNPMSGLVLSADALEHKMEASNGKLDSEKLDKFFYQIRHISSRVFNILDAMLKYGKSGTPHKVAVDIKPILENVCVLASSYAKNNNVSINNKVNDSKFVMGNQTRLEQVFINLIKNAIEAHNKTGQRNEVIISAEETDYMFKEKRVKGVKVTVSDNGKGISTEELVHIFDPFYTNEKYEGTGLGLSVVHDVVEDHSGVIDVDSNVGQGTVMTIYLPKIDEAPGTLRKIEWNQ